jgi:hypothetical protein
MNLLTYDEIFRASLIGLLFASAIFTGYFLISIPMNKHIKSLEDKADGV